MTTVNSTSTLHGLSNSVPEVRNTNFLVKTRLDRLSFTSKISGRAEPLFQTKITSNPYVMFRDLKTSLAEGQGYDKAMYFKYDNFNVSSTGRNMRIDMNPDKFEAEWFSDYQSTFLDCITDASVTRLDIAFDIEMDLSKHYFYLDGIRKQNIISDGKNNKETHYLGTRNSDRYVRLYNKKLELEQQGIVIDAPHLWRLEFELRNDWINKWYMCLDSLTLIDPCLDSLNAVDRLVVKQLIADLSGWSDLYEQSKYTYDKYRKLIKNLPPKIDLMPELENALQSAISDLDAEIRLYANLQADDVLSQNRVRH